MKDCDCRVDYSRLWARLRTDTNMSDMHTMEQRLVGTETRRERIDLPASGDTRMLAPWTAMKGKIAQAISGSRAAEIFGADLRSLAALRIVLALIVLLDLLGRAQNLRAHYTDAGVLSRRLLLSELNEWRWSVNLINGTAAFQILAFTVAAGAAIGMLLGYRTRMMTIIVWAMVVSLQVRNPMVLSGADTLLRLLLFWAMFLPLGAWWSIDRRRKGARTYRSMQFLSMGTVGIFAQIAFMYWFTALLKTGEDWRSTGTALQYALGARHVTRDLGEFLFQFGDLLRILTFASLGLEFVAPILLFSPFFTAQIRTATVFSIMAFQFGIMLTFDIGIFPWTSALCMVCFLPAWFWDRLLPKAGMLAQRFGPVRTVRRELGAMTANFKTMYRDQVVGRLWNGSSRASSNGESAEQAQLPFVGFGKRAQKPGTGVALRTHPVINLFAAFCLVFVLGWNIATVSDFTMPTESRPVAYGLGLYQRWSMFAPRPVRSTIWYVYRGTLADGTELDVLPTIIQDDLNVIQPLSWNEPEDISGGLYSDKYWRKYLDQIATSSSRQEKLAFASYICRTWNGHYAGDVRLEDLEIVRIVRPTQLDGDEAPVEQRSVSDFSCN